MPKRTPHCVDCGCDIDCRGRSKRCRRCDRVRKTGLRIIPAPVEFSVVPPWDDCPELYPWPHPPGVVG